MMAHKGRYLGWAVLIFFLMSVSSCIAIKEIASRKRWNGVYAGMAQKDFFEIYPKNKARTYRTKDNEQWMTFSDPLTGTPRRVVTFHFKNDRVRGWAINDRAEVVEEYLGEFCSRAFIEGVPKIGDAIRDVLLRIPDDAFLKITDRERPVLFTEVYDSGTAQFANTAEIIAEEGDAPAFTKGLTIIKLSTALDSAKTATPIKGIVAHELAHRYLEHAIKGNLSCESEREANRLIKSWGFEKEYEQASEQFGHKKTGGSVSCREIAATDSPKQVPSKNRLTEY